jgi:hypothetical protein
MNSRERRLSLWSNATCAMPLCEALTSCRGLRAHHAQKDRVGTWDIPRLAVSCSRRRSASGRRKAVADDARAREVGLRHSSCEAGEQSGAIRCGDNRRGVGGAKGGDQGECGPAAHAPDSAPHKRVTDAGSHTAAYSCRGYPRWEPYGKAARTDLCGGCEVTRIPTATTNRLLQCNLTTTARTGLGQNANSRPAALL